MTIAGSLPSPPTGAEVLSGGPGGRRGRARRMLAPVLSAHGLQRWLLWAGIALVLLFVVLAIFAPLISPYGWNQYCAHLVRGACEGRFARQGRPSGAHWFGTTVQAEDVLARVIYGARTAMEVVVLAVLFSTCVGIPLGLVSGYFGGTLDRVLVLIMDALFAFPYLLLAIVIAFVLQGGIGGGVLTAAVAIMAVYVPQYFRVVRNSVISVREENYVEAARTLGARPRTILGRYVFVNVIQTVPVVASLNAADAILTLAALSFLGVGVDPTAAAQWGYDVSRALSDAQAGYWWTGLYPGLAIILLVGGLTLLGEGLNDVYNPVLRRRGIRRVVLPARTWDDRAPQ